MDGADLSEAERDKVSKYLASPLEFPDEFKKWAIDWLGQNLPPIPIEQLQGYVKTRAYANSTGTSSFPTSSTSFADLGGPTITGLPDGTYLLIWGCRASGNYGRMAVSMNGSTPTDADSVYIETGGTLTYSGVRIKLVTLSNVAAGGVNTITTPMRKDSAGGPGTVTLSQCFLSAIRVQ